MQLIEEVITTLTLSSRRHPILLAPISRALLKLSDYDHNIVKLLLLAAP